MRPDFLQPYAPFFSLGGRGERAEIHMRLIRGFEPVVRGFSRGQALPRAREKPLFKLLILSELRAHGAQRFGTGHAVEVQAAVLLRVGGVHVYNRETQAESGKEHGLGSVRAQPVRADDGLGAALTGLADQFGGEFKAQAQAVIQQKKPRAEPGKSAGQHDTPATGQSAQKPPRYAPGPAGMPGRKLT